MTHAGIECFLAVCRYKTGSRAAQSLFITQSSLSTRLKALEHELGGPLFYRKQGCREMTLTAAGKEFYELAVQYEALLERMQTVCQRANQSLRVSSFNSIGTYLLTAVYERFMQTNPRIHLEMQDMELDAAIRSIQENKTDIAFTCAKLKNNYLVQIPVFSEPMVLITSVVSSYREPVEIFQLSLSDEVYVEWSNAFARWHQQSFGNEQPQITISIMAHLQKFIEQKQHWAIVPISVAEGLEKEGVARRLKTVFATPSRDVSCLSAEDNQNQAVIKAFLECLQDVIAEHPQIKSLVQCT